MSWLCRLLCVLTFFTAAPAWAGTALERAEAAWVAGDFAAGVEAGSADGSARGLTIAAQSALAGAAATDDPSAMHAGFDRSVELARAALAQDNGVVDAHLILASALGAQARSLNMMEAQEKGLATEAKGHIDAALRLDPNAAWAHAALGSWQAQIIGRIGPLMGMATYGASQPTAFEELDKAVKLDPGDSVLRFEFARAILLMRGSDGRPDAAQTLADAVQISPRTGFDRLVQAQARRLSQALAADDSDAVDDVLKWPAAPPPPRANPFAGGPAPND